MLDESGVTDAQKPDDGRRQLRGLGDAMVLLCGTGSHKRGSRLPDIPAVKSTLADLGEALVDRCGARQPRVVTDPRSLSDLGDAISNAAQAAEEILVLYYVGHGLVDPNGNLFLAAVQTDPRPNRLGHTALPYQTVREYVINSPARLKIVILDCCYSGIAIGNLSATTDIAGRAAIEGAYVLTSAARDTAALAPPRARYTAFSGKLIELLSDGDPDGGPMITLGSVYTYLDKVLPASGYPRPRQRTIGGASQFVLTDNPAFGGVPGPHRRLPPPRRRVRVPVVLSAVLGGTVLVPFLASVRHGGGWLTIPAGVRGDILRDRWGLLLLATTAALAAFAVAGPMAHWITRVAFRSRWRLLRRLRVPLLGLVAFVLATLLGSAALTAGAGTRVWAATCPTTAHVSVLVPAESQEPAREVAQAFERDTATGNFGCPDARLLVYSATAPQIHTALVRGWGDAEHVRIGPRPDVWLPDWSGETRAARAAAGATGRTLPIVAEHTVASTPMVLAVAAGSADAATETGLVDGVVWPKLLDLMRLRGWGTVVPDPVTSLGGLARIALYHPPADPGLPELTERTVERHIEQSYDRGNHTLGADAATLVCAPDGLRDRTGYFVTEQTVARFNHGDPIGPACPQRPPVRLRAVYAGHTPVLDRQAVRFRWTSDDGPRTRAAARFTEWLRAPDGRAALNDAGLRPPDTATGAPLTPDWGVQPDLRPRPAPISVDLIEDVQTRYAREHRPGRVLVAIDASRSMGHRGAGGSLWQIAARGVQQAMGRLGRRDEVGVWSFQGPERTGVRELVPVGLRDAAVRGQPRPVATARALGTVRPQGPAPLYRTIVAGLAEIGPTSDDRVTAMVLLTDGEDDNASALNARQFRAAVTGKGVRVFAIAMGTTGCAAPVLRTITTATAGKCLEADTGTVTDQLATIFEAVL
ncbi:caspase, EACC1-associated type [Jidongwangia harbinensis]|uniref:caspase, EACC1-associated type n=1 Tax=Jidongwangia harbinensis TaxID=2878561 RepID=UPI001CD9E83F|nr:substrate-binding domain-containing protein [Jidongwangia harbinensis]MCA2217930.1 substrate-binding domain-containing protein [Jidongwangia harbinensis]